MSIIDLWNEKERFSQQERKYLHFDQKVSLNVVSKFIANPEEIQRHYFYPFVRSKITTPRFKKDKETYKRKWEPKEREIMYASHVDSLIYSYYNILLSQLYEDKIRNEKFQESILAYRKLGKSNIDFAMEIFNQIADFGECIVLAFDVSSFFDTLNHASLKKSWESVLGVANLSERRDHLSVFKSLTKYSYAEKKDIEKEFDIKARRDKGERIYRYCSGQEFRSNVREKELIKSNSSAKGIPQGSPISALLSNIYMLNFDKKIYEEVCTKRHGIYRRYCDDILVVCKPDHGDELEKVVLDEIKGVEYQLEIQPAKTDKFRIVDRDAKGKLRPVNIKTGKRHNVQYLGFDFDGESIFIRSSSLSRYYRRMKYRTHSAVRRALRNKSQNVFRKKLLTKNTEHASRIRGNEEFKRRQKGLPNPNKVFHGNFISYAKRASVTMTAVKVLGQIKNHRKILEKTIQSKLALLNK